MMPEKLAVLAVTAIIAILLAIALMGSSARSEDDLGAGPQRVMAASRFADDDCGESWEDIDDLLETVRQGGARPRRPGPDPQQEEVEEDPQGEEPPAPTRYRILPGDTFDAIARRILGCASAVADILAANPGVDPRRLRPGQEINLPAHRQATPRQEPAPEREVPAPGGRWHVVAEGEALATISRRYYGSSQRWASIYEANRDLLRDPNTVRVGTRLRIP